MNIIISTFCSLYYFKVAKELDIEKHEKKALQLAHEELLLRISKMEQKVDNEGSKVQVLNNQCMSLTNDALSARNEFEKEFTSRLKLEDILKLQEYDYEVANNNMAALIKENTSMKKIIKNKESSVSTLNSKIKKLENTLELHSKENSKLKESLKVAFVDNKALVNQAKEAVNREQVKSQQVLKDQNEMLEKAKFSMSKECSIVKQKNDHLVKENTKMKTDLKNIQYQFEDLEDNMKSMQNKFVSVIFSSRILNIFFFIYII